jgi:hypothetical protein
VTGLETIDAAASHHRHGVAVTGVDRGWPDAVTGRLAAEHDGVAAAAVQERWGRMHSGCSCRARSHRREAAAGRHCGRTCRCGHFSRASCGSWGWNRRRTWGPKTTGRPDSRAASRAGTVRSIASHPSAPHADGQSLNCFWDRDTFERPAHLTATDLWTRSTGESLHASAISLYRKRSWIDSGRRASRA